MPTLPGSGLRWAAAGAAAFALALVATTFPAGAQSQAPQTFRDALRQRPDFTQPKPLPRAYRLTADRLASIRTAVATGVDYLPGEVLVKFRPGVTPLGQTRALSALRGSPTADDLRWVGDTAVYADPDQPDSILLALQLRQQPEVESAEPNYYGTLGPRPDHDMADSVAPVAVGPGIARVPSDPSYSARQWNLPAIDLPGAWDINDGADSGVTIAIIDSGLTTGSFSLSGPIWTGSAFETVTMPFAPNPDMAAARVVAPFDFIFNLSGGPVLDLDGHGSHVAGTAGQQSNNGIGLAGVAYNARIMPVKVCVGYWEVMIAQGELGITGFADEDLSICPYSEVAAGIRYAADAGASVINISLGGPSAAPVLRDAISYAVGRGAFVTMSMGNEFEVGNPVGYPAAYGTSIDGAMAVASVGRSLTRAFYSSTGSHAEISAPGGNSRDGGANGLVYQVTLGPPSSPFVVRPVFDQWFEVGYQGTSMAAPHVAGVAAMLMSQMPGLGPANVERLLKQTARPCSTSSCSVGVGMAGGRTDEFGFGLVQPRAALFGRGVAR